MEETLKGTEETAEEGNTQAEDQVFEDLLIRAFLVSKSFSARKDETRRCNDEFRV
ncbi:MAG: hypothetical protein WA175_05385 [Candidatus Acidiferrales bacterium]